VVTSSKLDFRILGPVEATVGGRPLALGGRKQRALLALLLLNANSVVSLETLVDELWGPERPSTATKSVQVHVSRLRRELEQADGEAALVTRAPGYVLEINPDSVDLARFERRAALGRRALAAGDARRAERLLRAALDEWRGDALADLALEPLAGVAQRRLDDQRVTAMEDWLDASLALGRHAELVGQIEELVRQHPFRERLRAQLVLALYRSGRQADALAAYRDARTTLVDQLGIDPGPELRTLERRVLEQDPDLLLLAAAPARPHTVAVEARRSRRRSRRFVAAAIAAVAVGAVGVAAVAIALPTRNPDPPPRVVGNSLVQIDADTGRIVRVIPVGNAPDWLTATSDAVWVANVGERSVSRIDLETGEQRRIRGFPFVDAIAADPMGGVYVSSFERLVSRIDPIRLLVSPFARLRGHAEAIVTGAGSLWVTSPSARRADGPSTLARIDPETGAVTARIRVGDTPIFATYGYGRVWVSNYDGGTVSVVTPGKARAETVEIGTGPLGIASGEGSIWIVAYGDRELVRLDPETREVTARIPIGNGPLSVAVGNGYAWVTNREDGTLLKIDPRKNEVVQTIDLTLAPHGVVAARGTVWATVRSTAY
jgi:DNA-binding SARP family transcriptional activator/DNA-binding beta-propeller fold protein YncE